MIHKKSLVIAVLSAGLLLTGCSHQNKQNNTNKMPSASSLIVKNKIADNGRYKISLKGYKLTSKIYNGKPEMINDQTTKLSGKFKYNAPIYLNYSFNTKKDKHWEKLWLTNDTRYLLLKGNHHKWLKMKADYNNFDVNQLTNRFNPVSLDELNRLVSRKASVKKQNGAYIVTYAGIDNEIWRKINPFIADSLNVPGTQNLNVTRALNATKPSSMQIRYIVSDNVIQDVYYEAHFALNNKLKFNWTSHYSDLGGYEDLEVPKNVKQNSIDIKRVQLTQKH